MRLGAAGPAIDDCDCVVAQVFRCCPNNASERHLHLELWNDIRLLQINRLLLLIHKFITDIRLLQINRLFLLIHKFITDLL
jgi:hypothetical protein